MNVQQLCEKISLPSEVRSRLADCFRAVDFGAVDGALRDFLVYEKIPDACAALQEKLGDDEDHMKMLACMLQASANAYAVYQERGVDDGIYVATMKCYTRFLNETYQRQAGMILTGMGGQAVRQAAICFESANWNMRSAPGRAELRLKSISRPMRIFPRLLWRNP